MPSLEWVDIEVDPTDHGGDPEAALALLREVYVQLTIPMRAVLEKVIDEPDEHSCQANGCASMRGTAGAKGVGWVLVEDDDEPWRSGCHWDWLTLIQHDGKVIVACEDCSPSNVYDKVTS
jgi:hypothetical protein